MTEDFKESDQSILKIALGLKYYIGGFVFCIGALSLAMAKMHPEKKSYAKDYNYLYSLLDDLQAGREVPVEKIEKKLEQFKAVRPEFDSFILDQHLKAQDFERAENLVGEIRKRSIFNDGMVTLFSDASIAYEKEGVEKGLEKCLELSKAEGFKENYPTLYLYNQFRIYAMEKELKLERSEKTRADLLSYIKSCEEESKINQRMINIYRSSLKKDAG